MAKIGDAKFNKVLNSSGGFVIDHDVIKYIVAKEIPANYAVYTPINKVGMRFGVDGDKLVSKIGLYIYEPVSSKAYITKNLKFVGFNLKTYRVTEKKQCSNTFNNGQAFSVYQVIGVEVL